MDWISAINLNTKNFKAEFGDCTPEQLLFKPSDQTWSIAENMHHLIVFNQSYFPIFSQLIAKTFIPSWSSRFSYINNLFGNLILNAVREDRNKRIKTFPKWEPVNLFPDQDIFTLFTIHQSELAEWIQKLEPLLGKDKIIHSPANKLISYSLDKAIEIIVTHEKRHLNQAMEVKKHFK
ncbi:DinB family protein [Anditalea andensis]|uniref:DinB-like domain-containing protein n=1 Tax=Anditalea andensis TaxID=1048983 RepID=A0A074L1W4_9BACT|nr:DinB family protein [Anditalea andensis]KEO73868.1 hypothetical protein EL17_10225 [Anditalea andensis]